jgi:hypothetical protein
LSSEMVMSLICLFKMQAVACTIWLSSHIWAILYAQIMNSWRMHVCFDACRSTNSFMSWDGTAINKVWIPWHCCGCIVIKLPKCLSNFCCRLCDVSLSFPSKGRTSEKKF